MESVNSNSTLQFTGRIDTRVHNKSDLLAEADDYESLTRKEKMELARDVEPEYEDTVYNVTTDLLHQYFVDNLDPAQTGVKDNLTISWLGLGTYEDSNGDGTGDSPQTSDVDLFNRTYEETVTDVADNEKELLASTFLDSTEGNQNEFKELGLFTGDPANAYDPSGPTGDREVFLINHATFTGVTKDSTKTVTFDVTLTFSDT